LALEPEVRVINELMISIAKNQFDILQAYEILKHVTAIENNVALGYYGDVLGCELITSAVRALGWALSHSASPNIDYYRFAKEALHHALTMLPAAANFIYLYKFTDSLTHDEYNTLAKSAKLYQKNGRYFFHDDSKKTTFNTSGTWIPWAPDFPQKFEEQGFTHITL